MDKEQLRNEYINIRKGVTAKKEKSENICFQIQNMEKYKSAKVIACYKALLHEVELNSLIEDAIAKGKSVLFPRVNNSELDFYKVSEMHKNLFEKSNFGVEEPKEECEKFLDLNKIDLIIVPGVCFDKAGNRLGFGKGYYDRLLQKIDAYSVGVCFKEQLADEGVIPTDTHDKKVNEVIWNNL